MKYPFTKCLFFLVAESVESAVDGNGEKRDDLKSPFMPSDNVEGHKRFIEDLADKLASEKGILTVLLQSLILYVILNSSLRKYLLQCNVCLNPLNPGHMELNLLIPGFVSTTKYIKLRVVSS